MSKKVDVSFMKMIANDDDWKREIVDGGPSAICSACPAAPPRHHAPRGG